jgi:hypothetical protein
MIRHAAILWACTGIIAGNTVTLNPGASPQHIKVVNPITCSTIPPSSITYNQSGAVVVTITPDATGYFLSVPSSSPVGSTATIQFHLP